MAISLDGASITLTREQAVAQIGGVYRQAREADAASLKAWVRLGAILLQLRPKFVKGEWGPFLKTCGIEHLNETSRAINAARELGNAHGHLDTEKLQQLFARWNAENPGRPLNAERPTVHTASIALGLKRPGAFGGSQTPGKDTCESLQVPFGSTRTAAVKWRTEPATGADRFRRGMADALGDDGDGEESSSSVAAGADRAAGNQARGPGTTAAAAAAVAEQLTLDGEYQAARRRFERVLGDRELLGKFNRWAAEQLGEAER
jgi:hypothetical protein